MKYLKRISEKISYLPTGTLASKFFALTSSIKFIIIIIALTTAWMLSGAFKAEKTKPTATPKSINIKIESSTAQEHVIETSYNGVTGAIKTVSLKPKTDGNIQEILVRDGQFLKKGEPIIHLDEHSFKSKLLQAEADLALQRINYKATRALFVKGLSSEGALASADSKLKEAETTLAQAKENLDQTYIYAPFDGYMDDITVEVGDYISNMLNSAIGVFSDLSRLKAIIHVPQREIGKISEGMEAIVTENGKNFIGKVEFVSKVASDKTHSFLAEIVFDNPGLTLKAGEAVRVIIKDNSSSKLHYIKKSTIGIETSGELIVKTISSDNKVQNFMVKIEDEDKDGFWVSGLPEHVRIITIGHPYVLEGEVIHAVPQI